MHFVDLQLVYYWAAANVTNSSHSISWAGHNTEVSEGNR